MNDDPCAKGHSCPHMRIVSDTQIKCPYPSCVLSQVGTLVIDNLTGTVSEFVPRKLPRRRREDPTMRDYTERELAKMISSGDTYTKKRGGIVIQRRHAWRER